MAKILVAPDSFKDCLSAREVSEACAQGIFEADPSHETTLLPMSDGGEGVLSILLLQNKLEVIAHNSFDPLKRPVKSRFLWNAQERIAYVSISECNGLELLSKAERNPLTCSSYGTGISIIKAIERKPKRIVLFLGGSSSNEAGTGIAEALGFQFYSSDGDQITDLNGSKLIQVHQIIPPKEDPLKDVQLIVAVDVKNPFFGEDGASLVYGPQKGGSMNQIKQLERSMVHFHALALKNNKEINFPGAGAAGGIAGGLSFFFDVEIYSAFSLISEALDIRSKINEADIVISGEGKLDKQSFNGKLVGEIYKLCQLSNTPFILICGYNELDAMESRFNQLEIFAENKNEILVTNSIASYTYIKKIGSSIGQKYE